MLFVKFVVQLIHFLPGFFEGAFSDGRDSVEPPAPAFNAIERGAQQSRTLQSVEKGIERAGTDAIPMMLELFHHGQPEDRFVNGVQQHVDADEAVEEFALLICHVNKYNSCVNA